VVSVPSYLCPDPVRADHDISFSSRFNLDSDIRDPKAPAPALSSGESTGIVARLHAILKPFLLRRLKVDVEKNLPPKKEYLLHAPVTSVQKELYENVVNRTLRRYLVDRKVNGGAGPGDEINVDHDENEAGPSEDTIKTSPKKSPQKRTTRSGKTRTYHIEDDDDKYFDQLESDMFKQPEAGSAADTFQAGKDFKTKAALKAVNNMKLQNVVMQLRKVASHPFLFDWPIDPETGSHVINEDLVNASGKMLLLNRLLDELHRRGHKVLVFSQFTTMLDIIEDWAVDYKGLNVCRIDGSTHQEDRRSQMKDFNEGGDKEGASNLFLLSTRAGGLGINLVAADTVIFFDSDWNPQADLQAMDRAHRIGQTKPVLVFRLVTARESIHHLPA
jgi:ATP-dependent DNA helicase